MNYHCRGCLQRKIACHATCKKYQQDQLDKEKENRERKYNAISGIYENSSWSYVRRRKTK